MNYACTYTITTGRNTQLISIIFHKFKTVLAVALSPRFTHSHLRIFSQESNIYRIRQSTHGGDGGSGGQRIAPLTAEQKEHENAGECSGGGARTWHPRRQ